MNLLAEVPRNLCTQTKLTLIALYFAQVLRGVSLILQVSARMQEDFMQIGRFEPTTFSPTTGQPSTAPNGQAPSQTSASETPAGAISHTGDVKQSTPGAILHLSSPADKNSASYVYSKGASIVEPKLSLDNMTLDHQLALGKQHGVFTKITLGKDGILQTQANRFANAPTPQEFVASAVTAMQDFQEGIALLKEQTTPANHPHHFLSDGLRNLQQVAARLNVFA